MSRDEITHLVNMANDIAKNVSPGKTTEQAVVAVKRHIALFWTPTMRDELAAHCTLLGDTLHPVVRQALE